MFTLRLKELRKEKGVSQQELAKKINAEQSQVSKWEQGTIQPNFDYLSKIANYFEVTTDYLLGRSSDIGVIQVNANLTEQEQELLYLFNKLNRDYKNQVIGFTKSLLF